MVSPSGLEVHFCVRRRPCKKGTLWLKDVGEVENCSVM